MNYLIGIDGGGTKTHCLLTDMDGNRKFECYGGPSNFLLLGTRPVSETLLDLIEQCREAEGFAYEDIASMVLCTTGAGRRSDAETMEKDFLAFLEEKSVSIGDFYVDSDARAALEASFKGQPGSILIAGTGSIMFGKDDFDEVFRVGGCGRFIGDEGSGFMLGRKALIAVAKDLDGRGSKTALTGMVKDEFGFDSQPKIITEVYANKFDIPKIAPLVIRAADEGDIAARRIIDEEADELILHIAAMQQKIAVKPFPLAFIGGILSSDNPLSQAVRMKVEEQLPDVELREPALTPPYGAMLLAQKRATQ